jgi:hypothetical protein
MIRSFIILIAVLVGTPLLASHVVQPRWVPLATVLLVGLTARIPAINGPAGRLLARLHAPCRVSLRWTTLVVGACAGCYLLFTATYQHRDLFPRLYDEHCYIIQSRMLGAGKLWEPQHPVADFFDNFYLLAKPVYASIYFPG